MDSIRHPSGPPPSPGAIALRCLALGLWSFGGAERLAGRLRAAFVARGWASEAEAGRGLALCRLLPGWLPHQLAVYLGWRSGGPGAGAVTGALCGAALLAPSLLVMGIFCWLAGACGGEPPVAGALRALSGAALAVLARAAWRQGRRALRHPLFYGFAAVALLMEWALRLKFYGVVIVAVLMGLWLSQARPDVFGVAAPPAPVGRAPWRARTGRIFAAGALFWLAAGLPALLLSDAGSLLPRMFNFYTRAGFFAFGGAYGQLSFFADMARRLSWLDQARLAQGLGLCAAAPGAAFPVAQWAGFWTCLGHPAGLDPLLAGTLGGLLAVVGLHLPGTLLVLACAPRAEACAANRWLRAAVLGVDAAMVGVIVKLLLVFGAASLWPQGPGPGRLAGADPVVLAAAAVMGLGLWRGKTPRHVLAAVVALAGAAATMLG
jgi:chromate transporter